jgi:hypothetical protein
MSLDILDQCLLYEYSVLYLIFATDRFGKPLQTWTRTYQLWRPGATEAEERPGKLPLANVLNSLGQEGWMLVSSQVVDSTITSHYGWAESGSPIRERWTFMREVRS